MAELYKVNSVAKRVRLMPTGEFIEVYEVSFTTSSGVSSSVDIPVVEFSTDAVKERVEAEAKKIEDVLNL
ncbi:MAG: hypothetical protein AB7C92_07930 [Synergistaceae bacterium]